MSVDKLKIGGCAQMQGCLEDCHDWRWRKKKLRCGLD